MMHLVIRQTNYANEVNHSVKLSVLPKSSIETFVVQILKLATCKPIQLGLIGDSPFLEAQNRKGTERGLAKLAISFECPTV